MALDLESESGLSAAPETVDPLGERTAELRNWLAGLEHWVEGQMAATRSLVALLDEEPSTIAKNR